MFTSIDFKELVKYEHTKLFSSNAFDNLYHTLCKFEKQEIANYFQALLPELSSNLELASELLNQY